MSKFKHGLKSHELYGTWQQMNQRCGNESHTAYHTYGGRGIVVTEEWRDSPTDFIAWVEGNLGPRPSGFTIDRIDSDGNYEKGNLRWADHKTQASNRAGRDTRAVRASKRKVSFKPALADDQSARIRFACRVWSTGSTYDAPAAAVRSAHELIDLVALNGAPASQEAFTRTATAILNNSENN